MSNWHRERLERATKAAQASNSNGNAVSVDVAAALVLDSFHGGYEAGAKAQIEQQAVEPWREMLSELARAAAEYADSTKGISGDLGARLSDARALLVGREQQAVAAWLASPEAERALAEALAALRFEPHGPDATARDLLTSLREGLAQ